MDEAQKAALITAASQCDHIKAAIRNIRDAFERAGDYQDAAFLCGRKVNMLETMLADLQDCIQNHL